MRVLPLICDLRRGASEHSRKCSCGCPDVSFCSCHCHLYSFELITGFATRTELSSAVFAIQFPRRWDADFGPYHVSSTQCDMVLETQTRYASFSMPSWPTSLKFYFQSSAFFRSESASSCRLVRESAVLVAATFLTYLLSALSVLSGKVVYDLIKAGI